ncbi:MAG: oxidoreductase [Bacteroidota bacterium]
MKKVWFITGISSGLGKALAAVVMQHGDVVIGTFRKQAQADDFNKKNAGKGRGVVLDVTDHSAIEKVITPIERIDVLVNNAGVGFIGAVEEATLDETRRVFEANFFSVVKITQQVLPKMRARRSGHIVQMSSHGGFVAFAGFGIYNASKFALEGFTEALAKEVAPLGIRTTLVEPGPFRTQFAAAKLPEAKKVIYDYAETAGAFRSKLKGVHGKQEGDPEKGAEVILEKVNSNSTSLRLPLGKVPLATMQMKLDSVKSDLESNADLAAQAVFKL